MRLHPVLISGLAAVLLLSGCSAPPEPKPETTQTAAPSASATPTPAPAVEPEAAFDVTCDDVTAELRELVGETEASVQERLSLWGAPGWYPGPAQYMFQRPGGIACSSDGGDEAGWEITIIPGARLAVDGLVEHGYTDNLTSCDGGICHITAREGDVLVSGSIRGASLSAADTARVDAATLRLAVRASESQREVEMQESELAGTTCLQLLRPEELSQAWGIHAELQIGLEFGGWGVPAHIYEVIDEAPLCYYSSAAGDYEADPYLTITGLPGGAWAFDLIEGRTPVDVPGADAAMSGTDDMLPKGRPYLDLLVGSDWIRLTTYEAGEGSRDLTAIAPQIVEYLSKGRPAPQ
ncbi:hypothetical protein [Microbacterium aurantiacum]|uniref:hypothetical protein n=1 Tax=Microbacterium aurantiacum TaxID=162393 RepID=UPI000C80CA09|nr:hypothetical protein [Microbacterium aurantiacum]